MDATISLSEIVSSLEQLGFVKLQQAVEIHRTIKNIKTVFNSDESTTTFRYVYDLQCRFNISGGWFWLFSEYHRVLLENRGYNMYSVVDLLDGITNLAANCMCEPNFTARVEQLAVLESVVAKLGNYLDHWEMICGNPGTDLVNKPCELGSMFCINSLNK